MGGGGGGRRGEARAQRHGLLLLPGSAFGAPGALRLSYGRLTAARDLEEAAARLARAAAEMLC